MTVIIMQSKSISISYDVAILYRN